MFHAAVHPLVLMLSLTWLVPAWAEPKAPQAIEAAIEAPVTAEAAAQVLQDWGQAAASVGAEPLAFVRQVGDTASGLVLSAMHYIGVPYHRGGMSADHGFDCSGFTRYVFEHSLGLVLPRRADAQARDAGLRPVKRGDLQPGDLVFFNTMRRAFSHVGIYVGEGRFIHAPRSGGEVRVEDMRQAYWSKRFNGARRAALAEAASPARP
jgi:cell wall-associated NlpC family hydrolase